MDLILLSPGVPYQLDQLANNQPKLSSFFTLKRSSVSNSASTHAPCQVNPEAEDSSLKVGTSGDTYFSEVSEPFEHHKQISRESDDLVNENSNASLVEGTPSSSGKPCEVAMGIPSNIDAKDESSVKNDLQSSHYQPAALVSSNCINNQNMKGSPRSMVSEPSNQSHSTLGDPNFVENYFKVMNRKANWLKEILAVYLIIMCFNKFVYLMCSNDYQTEHLVASCYV